MTSQLCRTQTHGGGAVLFLPCDSGSLATISFCDGWRGLAALLEHRGARWGGGGGGWG